MVRLLKIIGFITLLLILFLVAIGFLSNAPLPTGKPGPEADELAKRMQQAVNVEAWSRTGAVRWSFFGIHDYVWDRRKGVVEAKWGDARVLLRTADRTGRAWKGGKELTGVDLDKNLRKAYRYFINDSFWLNPIATFFDPSVTRSAVTDREGETQLLITYSSGGVTPGDSYLWTANADGLPSRWELWVQVIPIGGLQTSWEGWTELASGAKISTTHRALGIKIRVIRDLAGAPDLESLGANPDLFAPLVSR